MAALRAPKRRKTEHVSPSDVEPSATPPPAKLKQAFFRNAASWDLEQDYEQRKRKGSKKDRESTRLPIKRADGRVEHAPVQASDNVSVDTDDEDEDGEDGVLNNNANWLDKAGGGISPAPAFQPDIPEREQVLQAKEELAKLALAVSENAEDNVGAFKRLAEIAKSPLESVQKLALATQMAVYRDVIPGYRIRPLSEGGAPGERLSKEVRRLRSYEQTLVAGYQHYVRDLSRLARMTPASGRAPNQNQNPNTNPNPNQKQRQKQKQHVSSVAVACACTLLAEVPHFNFRAELLKIVVARLSRRRVDDDFSRCLATLQALFRDDEEGRPSMEAVSLLSKMARTRDYKVDESVVNLFLHLRLLSEFAGKGSKDRVDNPATAAAASIPSKKQRQFFTKKARKERKEHKALEKEMVQADAQVVHEERDRMQSEMLRLVFATYFRILKARVPHLMGAVLEGLAKYAHLINQDFFGDLLEALKDLIRHSDKDAGAGGGADDDGDDDGPEEEQGAGGDDAEPRLDDSLLRNPLRNSTRESLLCTVTAFALLAGQDAHNSRHALHLDLAFFTSRLFTSLLPLCTKPDLELTASTALTLALREAAASTPPTGTTTTGADSASAPPLVAAAPKSRVNAHTTTVLLLRALSLVLLPPWNIRSVPPLRLAAFSKQLMTAALHLPDKSCRAVLALLGDVMREHGRKVTPLWHTEARRADGRWEPASESVEGSNPRAATVWEGEILRRHYAPGVRERVGLLEKAASSG